VVGLAEVVGTGVDDERSAEFAGRREDIGGDKLMRTEDGGKKIYLPNDGLGTDQADLLI
jgi:hypothetical protein